VKLIVFTEVWFSVLIHVLNYKLRETFQLLFIDMLTLVLLEYDYETHLHLLNTLTHRTVRYYLHTSFIISPFSQLTWYDQWHCDMAGGYSVTCCKTTQLSAKQNIVITLQVVDSVSAVVTHEVTSVILAHLINVKFYPLTSIFIL